MSELDKRVVRVGLRTPGTGLRHADADQGKAFFDDVRDRFFEPATGAPRELAIEEVRELVLLWASGGAHPDSRRYAALLLELVACSIERGGPFATEVRAALHANLGELREFLPEIASEMDERTRAAIVVACRCAELDVTL